MLEIALEVVAKNYNYERDSDRLDFAYNNEMNELVLNALSSFDVKQNRKESIAGKAMRLYQGKQKMARFKMARFKMGGLA